MTYNGWTNHATWCVNLHLDNDAATYEDVRRVVRDAADNATAETYMTLERARVIEAQEAVKNYVEDMLDGICPRNNPSDLLARDMVSGYLEDVNWGEIAEAILQELELA